jgi:hypothetical protein
MKCRRRTGRRCRATPTAGLRRSPFSFQEQQNLYALCGKHLLGVARGGGAKDLTRIQTLAEWRQFWNIRASTSEVGTPFYEGDEVFAKTPDQLTPADFRLKKDSPGAGVLPGGKDIGADVDKVGPGKPYEEWKKTEDYQELSKKSEALLRSK